MLLNLQIVLCWFCRSFRSDLPRVFDWRNSIPIVRLFLFFFFFIEAWGILAILYFLLLFSLRASDRSPSETLVVTTWVTLISNLVSSYKYLIWISVDLEEVFFFPSNFSQEIYYINVFIWCKQILKQKYHRFILSI